MGYRRKPMIDKESKDFQEASGNSNSPLVAGEPWYGRPRGLVVVDLTLYHSSAGSWGFGFL